MKISIIATLVVVLAVAHGTEAVTLVKRDAEADFNVTQKLVDDIKASLTSGIQDMVEKFKALNMINTTESYTVESRTQIQPLVAKIAVEAEKLQEQMKPYISNIKEQIGPIMENFNTQLKPLTDDFQAQVKPLADRLQQIFQEVADQAKALMPPQ
ncbi:type-4 ice-structuring protein LS-12-like [Clinocottus analis]|uniref:type-4 ice-structuring protein LS-12-like n=1 Tax=Clinocottus analis TaxID=304258 RepID=UPI0035C2000C